MRLAGLYHPGGIVKIGEENVFIRPLRLIDIAKINAFLETLNPHPYESIRERVEELGPGLEQDRLLADALDAKDEWSPSIFGKEFVYLYGLHGMAVFLISCVEPQIDGGRAKELAALVDAKVFERIRRMAFGYDPGRELEAVWTALEPRMPVSDGDDGYAGLLRKFAEDYGWTAREVGELTLPQLRAYFPDDSPVPESVRLSRLERYERAKGVIDG